MIVEGRSPTPYAFCQENSSLVILSVLAWENKNGNQIEGNWIQDLRLGSWTSRAFQSQRVKCSNCSIYIYIYIQSVFNIRDVDLHPYEETRRNRRADWDLSNGQSTRESTTDNHSGAECPVRWHFDWCFQRGLFILFYYVQKGNKERRNQNQMQFNIFNKYLYTYTHWQEEKELLPQSISNAVQTLGGDMEWGPPH